MTATNYLLNEVQVRWLHNGDLTSNFEVYRSTSDQFSTATLIAGNVGRPFSDTSAEIGTAYHYWVRKHYPSGLTTDFAGPTTGHLQLRAPASITATRHLGAGVAVTWSAVAGAGEYEIYSDQSFDFDGSERLVGVASSTSITDSWENFPAGETRYWSVRAHSGDAFGLFSTAARGSRTIVQPPGAVASEDSLEAIRLDWTHIEDGQTEYRIYRSATGDPTVDNLINTVDATQTQWTDTNVAANHYYYYRVSCYDNIGELSPVATGVRLGGKLTDFIIRYNLSGEDAQLSADPDLDGKTTLEEWGFGGTDPLNSTDLPTSILRELTVDGDRYHAICYLRLRGGNTSATDYRVFGLVYPDFHDWAR